MESILEHFCDLLDIEEAEVAMNSRRPNGDGHGVRPGCERKEAHVVLAIPQIEDV
jgi:hypothetical protein